MSNLVSTYEAKLKVDRDWGVRLYVAVDKDLATEKQADRERERLS